MHLIVGLGNPGSAYAHHRHNVGFMAVEEIARQFNFQGWRSRFKSHINQGAIENQDVLALLPQTFMNESGLAVQQAMQFYKIKPENVIAFHDELDLSPGKIRVKKGGGAGGHNGLRSLDDHIGPEYWRVRIGIGHPGDKDKVTSYVLHDFSKTELKWLQPLLKALASEFPLMLNGQSDSYASRVAHLAPPEDKS